MGLILGPIAEEQLRRTLAISEGDPSALVTSPFAAVVYTLLLVFLAAGLYVKRRQAQVEEEIVHPHPEPTAPEGPRS